mmetsp:Transcript_4077/g.6400  ORF Transcript_4077/g.6400 Transcript_4077/m.6400 type:complete len:158 (-) Transcript_4077:121-594(-)
MMEEKSLIRTEMSMVRFLGPKSIGTGTTGCHYLQPRHQRWNSGALLQQFRMSIVHEWKRVRSLDRMQQMSQATSPTPAVLPNNTQCISPKNGKNSIQCHSPTSRARSCNLESALISPLIAKKNNGGEAIDANRNIHREIFGPRIKMNAHYSYRMSIF